MNQKNIDQRIARLLFVIFIYINDVEDQLSVTDLQRLNQLLDHPDKHAALHLTNALKEFQHHYPDFWQAYQNKDLQRQLTSVEALLQDCLHALGKKQGLQLLADLAKFTTTISTSPNILSLGFKKVPAARLHAIQEIQQLLAKQSHVHQDQHDAIKTTPPSQDTIGISPLGAKQTQQNPSISDAQATSNQLSNEFPNKFVAHPKICEIWPAAGLTVHEEYAWQRGKLRVRCVAVTPETHDVKTFSFVAQPGKLHLYKPGQFLSLELSIEGKTVRRSYTISSSPSRPHLLQITVKRVNDGLVSNWLHAHLQVGMEISISGPHGEFNLFDTPNEKLLLISAGSGITPVMSMLRWLADTQSTADIVFITYIRTPADAIFEQELRFLASRLEPRLQLIIMPKTVAPGQIWQGPVGGFSMDTIKALVTDFREREVFVCGPGGFMDILRNKLESEGHPPQHYHQESFGTPLSSRQASLVTDMSIPIAMPTTAPTKEIQLTAPTSHITTTQKSEASDSLVTFSKSGKTLKCASNEYLLDIAEADHIPIESSCRAGHCGTCKVRKLEGKVDMEGQQALSEADIADGYVLCCIGKPMSAKVVLEI
ncbi:hybrid-cluster NAD(P)-dependent oxidoreductase [Undibacterium flavidum]|uniref:2Fe-2S iron-sulfur cluster binding domain-containing protein n=1 Tax=Undibacterium flavidum TaxID=2762297 RepID=A0ABR6Y8V9_9BURK|nr:hybrid-cluster NAD(P)-dependent oxidoreductase [Undibacterium flavidum]MBC3872604.1 2Fe-2S iron-sulfur cluster binding domain-containing protein [Undibacterium flavidum]